MITWENIKKGAVIVIGIMLSVWALTLAIGVGARIHEYFLG